MKSRKRAKRIVTLVALAILVFGVVPVALAWPFNDVPPGHWAYEAIRRIATLHITSGCGGNNYCPDANVSRAQMAGFLNNMSKAWTNENEPYVFYVQNQNNGSGQSGLGIRSYSYQDQGLWGESDLGQGVYGSSVQDVGVSGVSFGNDAYNDAGVLGFSWGQGPAVKGSSFLGDGGYFTIWGDSYDDAAVNAEVTYASSGAYGVIASSYNNDAGHFESQNWDGIYSRAASEGWGAYLKSATNIGVYGWVEDNSSYGLYTPNALYAGGGCVGCTSMLIAQNGGDETLQVGDLLAVVGIAEEPTQFYARPVLLVRKAAGPGGAVVGVVAGRYTVEQVTKETRHPALHEQEPPDTVGGPIPELVTVKEAWVETNVVENPTLSSDPVAPGERMTVVYRGIAKVMVDASAGAVQVGDRLQASANAGQAVLASGAEGIVLGMALEPLAEGQGLIWVLVDLQ